MKRFTLLIAILFVALFATPLYAETGEEATATDWDTILEYGLYIAGGVGAILLGWASRKASKFIASLTIEKLRNIIYGVIAKFADGDEKDQERLRKIVDIAGDSKFAKHLLDQAKDTLQSRLDYIEDKVEDYRLKLDTLGEDMPKEHRDIISNRIATLLNDKQVLEQRKEANRDEETT